MTDKPLPKPGRPEPHHLPLLPSPRRRATTSPYPTSTPVLKLNEILTNDCKRCALYTESSWYRTRGGSGIMHCVSYSNPIKVGKYSYESRCSTSVQREQAIWLLPSPSRKTTSTTTSNEYLCSGSDRRASTLRRLAKRKDAKASDPSISHVDPQWITSVSPITSHHRTLSALTPIYLHVLQAARDICV